MYLKRIKDINISFEYVTKLSRLKDYRGKYKEDLARLDFNKTKSLLDSVIASNEIEGITVATTSRATDLLDGKEANTKEEVEFQQNAILLTDIFNNYENIRVSKGDVANLHKQLMEPIKPRIAGMYTGGNKVVSTNLKTKVSTVIHSGSTVIEVEQHVNDLFDNLAHARLNFDSFIVSCVFIAEFLTIHPFQDGNGRISRALFNLLLLQEGYYIPKMYSIDKIIEERKQEYYDSLSSNNEDWKDRTYNPNSLLRFVYFMIDVVYSAYEEYDILKNKKKLIVWGDKKNMVAETIDKFDAFSTGDILRAMNDSVSRELVSKVLAEYIKKNKITKSGKGKGTKYKKA